MLVFESSSRIPAYTAGRAFEVLLARLCFEAGIYRDLVSELEELLQGSEFWERTKKQGTWPDLAIEYRIQEVLGTDLKVFRNRWEVLELASQLPEFREALDFLAQSLPEETPDWLRILEEAYATARLVLVD
jgi:hypothetical protein